MKKIFFNYVYYLMEERRVNMSGIKVILELNG